MREEEEMTNVVTLPWKTVPANLEFHPLAQVFPLMTDAELADLAADIKANGLKNPITVFEGKVLDGRNRYIAATKAKYQMTQWEDLPKGVDPIGFVVSMNLKRRHLTESQRGMVAAELAKLAHGSNRFGKKSIDGSKDPSTLSNAQAAKLLAVSEPTVKRGKKVKKDGIPELVEAVKGGEIKLLPASKIATQPREKQKEAIAAAKQKKSAPKPKSKPKSKPQPKSKMTSEPKETAATSAETITLPSRNPREMAKAIFEAKGGMWAVRVSNELSKLIEEWKQREIAAGNAFKLQFNGDNK